MVILKLNQYEVVTLSSFSKIKMNKNSPLIGHYAIEMVDYNQEGYRKAFDSFKNNGFIVPEKDDYTLATELESAFLLMHQPEVTVSFKRIREINISEVCFAFKKGFALQYITTALGKEHILAYPHVLPSVGAWIRKELFVNLEFSDKTSKHFKAELATEELIILFVYMSFLKIRVENKNDILTEEECFVPTGAIRYFDRFDEMEDLMFRYMGDDSLKKYIRSSPNVDQGLNALISKGLMTQRDEEISLTEYGKEIFNPGNMRECFIVGEHLPESNQLTTINIFSGGYIILKTQLSNDESPKILLEVCPSSADIAEVMKIACPAVFSQGFGDEVRYNQSLENQKDQFMKDAPTSAPTSASTNASTNIPTEYEKTENVVISEQTHKFCQHCGTKLSTNAKFCNSCGEAQ